MVHSDLCPCLLYPSGICQLRVCGGVCCAQSFSRSMAHKHPMAIMQGCLAGVEMCVFVTLLQGYPMFTSGPLGRWWINLFIWTCAVSLAQIGHNGPLCCGVECISRQLDAAQPVYHSHVLSLSSSAVHDVSGPSMFMGVVPITPGWLTHTHVMQDAGRPLGLGVVCTSGRSCGRQGDVHIAPPVCLS
jgi:hypothetical protein